MGFQAYQSFPFGTVRRPEIRGGSQRVLFESPCAFCHFSFRVQHSSPFGTVRPLGISVWGVHIRSYLVYPDGFCHLLPPCATILALRHSSPPRNPARCMSGRFCKPGRSLSSFTSLRNTPLPLGQSAPLESACGEFTYGLIWCIQTVSVIFYFLAQQSLPSGTAPLLEIRQGACRSVSVSLAGLFHLLLPCATLFCPWEQSAPLESGSGEFIYGLIW